MSRNRWLRPVYWLVTGMGAAGLLTVRAARVRGTRSNGVPITPPATGLAPVAAAPSPPTRRWLYLPLAAAGGLGLVALQLAAPLAAAVLFALLLVVALLVAVWPLRQRLPIVGVRFNRRLRDLVRAGSVTAEAARAWAAPRRRRLAAWLTLLALALLAGSAWGFSLALSRTSSFNVGAALVLLAGGGAALVIALGLRDVVTPALVVRLPVPAISGRSNWLLTGAGVLALALVTEYNTHTFAINARFPQSTDVQFILLVAGILLVIVGLGGLRSTGALVWRLATGGHSRRALLLLLAITLLALGLRAWNLQDSMRFLVDEEAFASAVRRLLVDDDIKLLAPFSSITAFPYLFPYLQEQTVVLFGRSLIGLRMAGAVLGALTVPALYLLARALFDRKTALLAALLLATFPPHLHFSRIGLNNIADPLVGTLALALMARGLRSGRRVEYAAAGAMLGLTQYFYEGGRIFFTPLLLVWVAGSLVLARAERRVPWRGLLTAALALLIVSAPVYMTLIGLDRPLFARMVDHGTGLPADHWRGLLEEGALERHLRFHVAPSLLVYTSWADRTLFYRGSQALVLPLVQPLLFLGLIIALRRWRVPGLLLLLLWIGGVSAGNSLMVDSTASPRFVTVLPALALAGAVGLRYTLPLVWPSRQWETFWPRALVALGIAAAGVQIVYYYGEHLPMFNHQFRMAKPYADGYDAALRAASFPARTDIYVIAPDEVNLIEAGGLLHLMREDLVINSIPSSQLSEAYLRDIPCRRDIAFFIRPDDAVTLHRLRANFYLRPPERSPFADIIPDERELLLYYAPYLPGLEQKYQRCNQGS
ncbi:MAG: glycosyltransferase family 39 protein [Chloroflexi bacterium]|nr:glycosyltransferase family 39 protein [Chloroflexota bacterium]